jgi:hypothetical protein
MGNSDPLRAGFEIRFGSLNFQATGNGYLMRLTNHDELRARRQTGGDPDPRRARCSRPGVRPGGCCGPFSAVTPSTLQPALVIGVDGAPTRCARCLTARRDHRRDGSRSNGGTLGFRTAVPHRSARRHDHVRRLLQHRRGGTRGPSYLPCFGSQEPQCLHRRRVVLRLRQRAATRHLTRVRGVGLLRRAGPSNVPAVSRRHGLLVRLLQQL